MATPPAPQPNVGAQWIDPTSGRFLSRIQQYLFSLDAVVRLLAGGNVGPLFNAVNDAAAAAGGVAVGGLYRNGNAVQIRLV